MITYRTLSSLVDIETTSPDILHSKDSFYQNPKYAKHIEIGRKKHNKYIVDGILDEFSHSLKPKGIGEAYINNILRHRLLGESIPEKGFMVDLHIGYQHMSKIGINSGKLYRDRKCAFLDLNLEIPNDCNRESSFRQVSGVDDITVLYSIPLRFLSSKVNKKAPPRGNYWVYRVRFILKENDKDKFDKIITEQYYNGYIGVSGRHGLIRLAEHIKNYKAGKKTSLYENWSSLQKNQLDHIVIFEILDRVSSEDEMFNLEQNLIDLENTLEPYGFNMVSGGKSGDAFLKENGIICTDKYRKDEFASVLFDKNKKKFFVRGHPRKLTKKWTYVRGYWKGLDKD